MQLEIQQVTPEFAQTERDRLFLAIMESELICLFHTDPPKYIFIGSILGKIIGMSEVAILNPTKRKVELPTTLGEISYYVDPEARGHQYGEKLMDHAIGFVEQTLQLPVCAIVSPDSYSEWLLMTRGFQDISKDFFGNLPVLNKFYLRDRVGR